MQIMGSGAWQAFQSAPQGKASQPPTEQERPAKPLVDQGDDLAPRLPMFGQAPDVFWRATQGEPDPANHIAPPSIMQIRITRLLNEQAVTKDAQAEEVEATKDSQAAKDSRLATDQTEQMPDLPGQAVKDGSEVQAADQSATPEGDTPLPLPSSQAAPSEVDKTPAAPAPVFRPTTSTGSTGFTPMLETASAPEGFAPLPGLLDRAS